MARELSICPKEGDLMSLSESTKNLQKQQVESLSQDVSCEAYRFSPMSLIDLIEIGVSSPHPQFFGMVTGDKLSSVRFGTVV